MSSERIFYWGSGSPPCWRAMLALEEKGIEYEDKLLSFDKKEHKEPGLLKLNPRGQLPTFKDGNLIVNESLAIIDYLEAVYPDKGIKLLPKDKAALATTLQRKYEVVSGLEKKLMQEFAAHMYMLKPEDLKELSEESKKKLEASKEELKIWNGYLEKSGGDFIAGKDFTVADVLLIPILGFLYRFGFKGEKSYPAIEKYWNKVKERPSVKKSTPPHWKGTDPPKDFCKLL